MSRALWCGALLPLLSLASGGCHTAQLTSAQWNQHVTQHLQGRHAELLACYREHVKDQSPQAVYVYYTLDQAKGALEVVTRVELGLRHEGSAWKPGSHYPTYSEERGDTEHVDLRNCVRTAAGGLSNLDPSLKEFTKASWLVVFDPNQEAPAAATPAASVESQP